MKLITFFMSKIRQKYSRPLTVPESKNKASVTFHVFFTNFAYDRKKGRFCNIFKTRKVMTLTKAIWKTQASTR